MERDATVRASRVRPAVPRTSARAGTDAGAFRSPHGGARLSTLLVHSGTLLCMDPAFTVTRGDVLVRDGTIAAVGDAVPAALAGAAPD